MAVKREMYAEGSLSVGTRSCTVGGVIANCSLVSASMFDGDGLKFNGSGWRCLEPIHLLDFLVAYERKKKSTESARPIREALRKSKTEVGLPHPFKNKPHRTADAFVREGLCTRQAAVLDDEYLSNRIDRGC